MKRVLVTAGRSNLGKSIREVFEKEGYEVFYTVSSEDKADSEKAIAADLTKEKEIDKALEKLESLDVLVNNAGIFTEGSQETLSIESFGAVMALNVKGLFLVTRKLIPLLKKSDGSIVNVSSMNAVHPGFGATSHYDASKGAVSAYTASLAAETGLRVNAVAPGLIDTQRLHGAKLESHWKNHTVKREMVKPEYIANAILFLAQSRGIYGQTLLIDNGYCLR
ncbi:MAG: SDR family NAD(P)-dependent oxidoreductase [Sphaerochaeta sp.]